MAEYTMQLRTLIEQPTQYKDGLSWNERIEEGRKTLFDFDYPIFDENYRKVFETHFIRHFYTREIGSETEGLFKFRLETWLNIHMPYFNKMFDSELIEYDPLTNSKAETKYTKNNDRNQVDDKTNNRTGSSNLNRDTSDTVNTNTDTSEKTTGKSTSDDDNFNRQVYSDTADGRLSITANDGEGVIEYATNITEDTENNKNNSTSETSGTGNSNTDQTAKGTLKDTAGMTQNDNEKLNSNINEVEDYVQNRFGKIGVQSFSKMVQEFRASFIRVERDIFNEMNELFMLVY